VFELEWRAADAEGNSKFLLILMGDVRSFLWVFLMGNFEDEFDVVHVLSLNDKLQGSRQASIESSEPFRTSQNLH
jgi:hypothetical protein